MINNIRTVALAGLVAMLVTGWHSDAQAACNLMVPPIKNNVCQQGNQQLPNYGLISCEKPRNHDQTTFCAAVYGYERHWCDRIKNSVLRQECWDRTE